MQKSEAPLLSVPEVAALLGVTPSCIRRWVLLRKVCSVRVGRLVRISLAEVERIITEGTIPANRLSKPGKTNAR